MQKNISRFLGITSILIFLFAVLFLILDFISAKVFDFDFSTAGVDNFLNLYDNTIKSLVAFLAILTLYIASKKLNTSIEQTEAVFENNKFNNYFKHKEYFFDHLSKSTIVTKFSKTSQIPPYYSLAFTYNYFYKSDYKLFVPEIKSSAHAVIEDYQNAMDELIEDWEKQIVSPAQLEIKIIEDLFDEHKSIIEEQIKFLISDKLDDIRKYWRNEISQGNKYPLDPDQASYEFEQLAIFYWTISFFNDVLLFDSSETIDIEKLNDIFDTQCSVNGLA